MTLEQVFALVTVGLVAAGVTMVGLSIRAYARSSRPVFVRLAIGFAAVAVAAALTGVAAFRWDFRGIRTLLTMHYGLAAIGYLFITYSLVSFRRPGAAPSGTDRPVAGD